MINDPGIYKEINNSIRVQVRLGNGTMVESKGKGTIMVETKEGTTLINDVILVPKLKENLLALAN